ncbi:uncharacterized protein LOC132545365 [Ylistrum balloti]|uniref:uncharacterized protein LOC132545365 n=1 Tax=Ylistrum balloti TaxID=509963 RepID=UPI0029058FBE|nr:uncharacterized protein LOC132545365 [Ylistrum balloti]
MKVVLDSRTDELVSVSLDGTKTRIHIYRQCRLQGVVAVPELVLDMCVGSQVSHDTANKGWLLYILTCCQLYVVDETQVVTSRSEKGLVDNKTKGGNQEIFSELLGKGSIFGMSEFEVVSQPVYQVTRGHSLLEVGQEVASLAVGCGVIVIASCSQDRYVIQLYLMADLHSETPRNKLPVQTYVIHRHLTAPGNDQELCQKLPIYTEHGQELHSSPSDQSISLHLVMPNDGISDQQRFSSVLEISKDIFQAFCGFELSLLNSPLLLLCPPEGSVYYAPIKSLDTIDKTVRIFCHTHHPVIKVGKIEVKVTDRTDGVEGGLQDTRMGLVVISKDGRALLATLENSQKLEFIEFALPGSILDIDMHDNKIYQSTDMDVFESKLEISPEPLGLSCRTVELMYAGVKELACLHNNNHIEGGECNLMLMTPGLQPKVINPAVRQKRGKPSVGAGHIIRDLLGSISKCNQETEALQQQKCHQTKKLSQLNMAAFLSTQDPHSPDFPLQFSVSHVGTRPQQNNDWVLSCHMTNISNMYLSGDWTVMIILSDNKHEFMTLSFPVPNGLGPETSLEFHLVPPTSHCSLLRPVEVKTSLLIQANEENLSVMNIPISTFTLDILYGMVTSEDVTAVTSLSKEVSVTQLVREIAEAQPISKCLESLPAPTPAMVSVHVPNHVLESDQLSVYHTETCPLLSYLLKSSSVNPRNNSVSMVTAGGHKVQLTTEGNLLTIHSDKAEVTIATRQAIINRLLDISKQGTKRFHHCDRLVHHLNSLQHLQDKLSDLNSGSYCTSDISKYQNKVFGIYHYIRSTAKVE